MNLRVLLQFFFVSAMSMLFFQNCSKKEFAVIDSQQKYNTLEAHGGLGPNDQSDNGLSGNGGPNQTDGGLGRGPSTTDGGIGGGPSTPDGGLGGGPSTPDMGMGGGMLGPGGMVMIGPSTPDGGLTGGPSTPDGGLGGGPSTPDGGIGSGPSTPDGGMGGGLVPGMGGRPGGPSTPDGGMGSGPSTPDGGMGSGPSTPDGGNSCPNCIFDVKGDAITNPKNGRFNVIRWCRDNDQAATLKRATNIKIELIEVLNGNEKVICTGEGKNLLDQIIADGMVDIPGCDFSMVKNGRLLARVTDQNGKTLSDGTDNGTRKNAYDDTKIDTEDNRSLGRATALHLLYDRDVDKRNQGEKCDAYNTSPLVVDMRRSIELREIFEMTSPSFGVIFDILGNNSYPSEFTKKKISWFKDPRIMPIVLPNGGAEIGINEMFGDNTLGPDGEFSPDGFAALAKYDGRNLASGQQRDADGYITEDDEIFEQLRLWYDRNLDGTVDPGELISLKRARVEVIDLRYDPNYYSRDAHGNEIKYKSVVKLSNGQYKPVFDVWFVIDNRIQ